MCSDGLMTKICACFCGKLKAEAFLFTGSKINSLSSFNGAAKSLAKPDNQSDTSLYAGHWLVSAEMSGALSALNNCIMGIVDNERGDMVPGAVVPVLPRKQKVWGLIPHCGK